MVISFFIFLIFKVLISFSNQVVLPACLTYFKPGANCAGFWRTKALQQGSADDLFLCTDV
ncbi:MAG: hypothetical protein COW65_06235 [Cytophagales bacterium CG18_big_fil_WC_8_21_14_2_50_42_9]|nr:MAG: hypothetical protein COW65_06235 [Cytophagales bacterium CG18_big_fil_WC_8_21_14_2_50_42_9]